MSYFNIVAATSENTVVTEYTPEQRTAEAYQSEAELEREFIRRLGELGYAYLTIRKEEDLPEVFMNYVKFIENYLGTRISIISLGPDREATIERV